MFALILYIYIYIYIHAIDDGKCTEGLIGMVFAFGPIGQLFGNIRKYYIN